MTDEIASNIASFRKEIGEINVGQIAPTLDMVNGYLCAYDRDGKILYMNSNLKDLLGYTDQMLMNAKVVDLAIKRHRQRIMTRIAERLQSGAKSSWELPVLTVAGREIWVVAKTAPMWKNDKIVGEILLLEDISERKKKERELLEAQQSTANIIEYLPDPTTVCDTNHRTLFWNRAMVELTGVPASDVVGTADYRGAIAFYGIRRPTLLDYLINAKTSGYDEEYEFIARDGEVWIAEAKTDYLKPGQTTYLWARAAPVYNLKGELIGAVETVRDVSEHKARENDLKQSHERLQAIFSGTVHALSIATEKRDPYTAGHQRRVSILACLIGTEMGLSEKILENIRIAGILHDIGKLYIPLDILNQSGPLTDLGLLFMKTHPSAGHEIIENVPFEGPIAEIILQHHERLDGSGYPRGLSGEQILLEARILAVADVVEAMCTHRPYRHAIGLEKAVEEIKVNAGKLYDSQVVEACVRVIKAQAGDNKASMGQIPIWPR